MDVWGVEGLKMYYVWNCFNHHLKQGMEITGNVRQTNVDKAVNVMEWDVMEIGGWFKRVGMDNELCLNEADDVTGLYLYSSW